MNSGKHVSILFPWKLALALALCFLSAHPASAQTAASALPIVIDSCFYYPPPSKDRLCQSWVRVVDRFEVIGGGNMGVTTPQQFDKNDAVFGSAHFHRHLTSARIGLSEIH
jgi:hypothetical protein